MQRGQETRFNRMERNRARGGSPDLTLVSRAAGGKNWEKKRVRRLKNFSPKPACPKKKKKKPTEQKGGSWERKASVGKRKNEEKGQPLQPGDGHQEQVNGKLPWEHLLSLGRPSQ